MSEPRISVVTPTLHRPEEVAGLLQNLAELAVTPAELILVDGAPKDLQTEAVVRRMEDALPYVVRYIRAGGGTALQRNAGIDVAEGDYIAFIDDDIRLRSDYLGKILEVFASDATGEVGGVVGYIENQYLDPSTSPRWRAYRRFRCFTTYEPGRYDFRSGYPINRSTRPPHEGIVELDFMGSNCAVWRTQVFGGGLRFGEFFRDYGMLEDAHLALRAGRSWRLLETGSARCTHLNSQGGRVSWRSVSRKTAVNYRYVFLDIVPERTWREELRFWRVQLVQLLVDLAATLRSPTRARWSGILGKLEGMRDAAKLAAPDPSRDL